MTIPSIGEKAKQMELSFTAMGNAKWSGRSRAHFGRFSWSETHTYHRTQNSTPGYLPKRNKKHVSAQRFLLKCS